MRGNRGGNSGRKPASKYERRAARQRQLDMMEAAASGTIPSMQLETLDLQNRNVSMRQRNQETARRFLYDEDEATPTTTSAAPAFSGTVKTGTTANLFVGRTPGDMSGMDTVNLMDHETGVYTSEDRSFMGRMRRFLFGPETHPGEHDAMAADTEVYLGEQARASRTSTALAKLRYWFCSSRQRCLSCLIGVAALFLAAFYTAGVLRGYVGSVPAAPTAEQILRSQNSDRFILIMEHLVGAGLGTYADFVQPTTAPSRALRWIAYTDKARLDPDHPMIPQRYALAAFFYRSYNAYVEDIGTALRTSKPIEMEEDDQFEGVPNAGWYDANNWLSEKGFCLWYGVECELRRSEETESRKYDDNANIYSIILPDNFIQGSIDGQELKALHDLERLDLSSNQIRGNFLSVARDMPKLRYIKLQRNQLTGTLPRDVGHLQSLLEMYLQKNKFSGSVPSEINRLTNLRVLDMSENSFERQFPTIRSLSNLRVLYLSNNQFNGTVPFSIAELDQIRELYIEKNHFYGTVHPEFESFRHMQVLSMNQNDIRGPFPNAIFKNNLGLKKVMIHDNKLTGRIPTMAGLLQELEVLEMHNNLFTGTFPTQWTDMPSLQILHLHNNVMHGIIPSTVGHLTSVKELWLSNNTLTGSIPSEMGSMSSLEFAYLDHNHLQHAIPTEMGRMKSLQTLRLEFNPKLGNVPEEVCNLKSFDRLKFISADCRVKCVCCNKCYESGP